MVIYSTTQPRSYFNELWTHLREGGAVSLRNDGKLTPIIANPPPRARTQTSRRTEIGMREKVVKVHL